MQYEETERSDGIDQKASAKLDKVILSQPSIPTHQENVLNVMTVNTSPVQKDDKGVQKSLLKIPSHTKIDDLEDAIASIQVS